MDTGFKAFSILIHKKLSLTVFWGGATAELRVPCYIHSFKNW